jgi:2',3'-cyclic-nucleotide 2'-phosphodiesterase (5'-nucleotidase family)
MKNAARFLTALLVVAACSLSFAIVQPGASNVSRGTRVTSGAITQPRVTPIQVTPAPMSDQLLDSHIFPANMPPNRASILSIIYNGYRRSSLEPCGCVSHKLGGIDREAKVIERLTSNSIPLVKLEAGGYIRDMAAHSDGLRAASKYLLKALAALDYGVFNVAATDAEMGRSFLEECLGNKADRLISANLVDPVTSKPLFATKRVIPVRLQNGQTVRVGVTGITRSRVAITPGGTQPVSSSWYAVADPVASLSHVLDELEKESDVVVLLAYMNREALANDVLNRLGENPKVDVAIAGEYLGTRNDIQNVAGVRVVSGGFEGRQVGHLVLEWRDGKIAQAFNKLVEIEQSIPPVPEITKYIEGYLQELKSATAPKGEK